jgi:hypothetical protein
MNIKTQLNIFRAIFSITSAIVLTSLLPSQEVAANAVSIPPQERMVEWTVASKKAYADPFNDVDVDVVFSDGHTSWRVPAFWRGGQKWTVRFAPPQPGEYNYRLESSDRANADLHGPSGRVTIAAYRGSNPLFKHGALRLSNNKRYFEHADGTPFYWLGDTWWAGLSTNINWEDFKALTADRVAKGFTVVHVTAGLVPEESPDDPATRNEGGPVWETEFKRINPAYFDYADRRIEHLLRAGMVPAIVGAWGYHLRKVGVSRMKKHWRYIIGRYGAYPVFWIGGGEIFDPPEAIMRTLERTQPGKLRDVREIGWTEVVRYIRDTDPYHHPLSVHEIHPPYDVPLQDSALTDFSFFQPSHFGWASIAVQISQLTANYNRPRHKPLIIGEIGYEKLGEQHLEDFQRVAFWMSMLNGAAGHSYGAIGTWQSYSASNRRKWSLLTWRDGMNLPGSQQVGLNARLLRNYPWWQLQPRPDWLASGGTTLLDISDGDIGATKVVDAWFIAKETDADEKLALPPAWLARQGTFRRPYAAGIPGQLRIIYQPPYFHLFPPTPPTVLSLEPGVKYRAYFWEPALGIKIDLGAVQRPPPSKPLATENFAGPRDDAMKWIEHKSKSEPCTGGIRLSGDVVTVATDRQLENTIVAVDGHGEGEIGLLLNFKDENNYLAAIYDPRTKSIHLMERIEGVDAMPIGVTSTPTMAGKVRMSVEVRAGAAIASVSDGHSTYFTPILDVTTRPGYVGFMHKSVDPWILESFEISDSPLLTSRGPTETKFHDARGNYRGEWPESRRRKEQLVLLGAYRPDALPTNGDWIMVLENSESTR